MVGVFLGWSARFLVRSPSTQLRRRLAFRVVMAFCAGDDGVVSASQRMILVEALSNLTRRPLPSNQVSFCLIMGHCTC